MSHRWTLERSGCGSSHLLNLPRRGRWATQWWPRNTAAEYERGSLGWWMGWIAWVWRTIGPTEWTRPWHTGGTASSVGEGAIHETIRTLWHSIHYPRRHPSLWTLTSFEAKYTERRKLRLYRYEGEEHLPLVLLTGWTAFVGQTAVFDAVDYNLVSNWSRMEMER